MLYVELLKNIFNKNAKYIYIYSKIYQKKKTLLSLFLISLLWCLSVCADLTGLNNSKIIGKNIISGFACKIISKRNENLEWVD